METQNIDKTLVTISHTDNSEVSAELSLTPVSGFDPTKLHLATINTNGTAADYTDDSFVSKYVINGTAYPYNPSTEGGNQFIIYGVKLTQTGEDADRLHGEKVDITITWNKHLATSAEAEAEAARAEAESEDPAFVAGDAIDTDGSRAKGYIVATKENNNYDFETGAEDNSNNALSSVELNGTSLKTGQTVGFIFVYAEGKTATEGTADADGSVKCDFIVTASHHE